MRTVLIPCQEFSKGKASEPRVHVWIKNYSRRGQCRQSYCHDGKGDDPEGDSPSNRRQQASLLAQCTIHGAVSGFGGAAFPSFGVHLRSVLAMQGRSSCLAASPGYGAGCQESHGMQFQSPALLPSEILRNYLWRK
ncbi:hypothetical protein L1049_016901 [Liquidambar formosana]|uniref:Uncharacterized protein n=1 Tax=Liquidambar formosana TaxID=63359 RepID=A0AAP0X0X1_LIQFO